jgi:hypothetical protein
VITNSGELEYPIKLSLEDPHFQTRFDFDISERSLVLSAYEKRAIRFSYAPSVSVNRVLKLKIDSIFSQHFIECIFAAVCDFFFYFLFQLHGVFVLLPFVCII